MGLAGCGSGDGAPITATEARQAVGGVFGRPLADNIITGPSATTKRIAASFTGGTAPENLVAVVFTEAKYARAFTGNADHLSGPQRVQLIRVANVVVLYTRRRQILDRSSAFRRALLQAVGGGSRAHRDGERLAIE